MLYNNPLQAYYLKIIWETLLDIKAGHEAYIPNGNFHPWRSRNDSALGNNNKKKLRGFSPQANYTDRTIAAGQRS
jgi:hypothetical protein